MNVVIFGATRGMGRALARLLADRKDAIFLLGRSADELAHSAADLEARGAKRPVGHAVCDLGEPDSFDAGLGRAVAELGRLDAVVLTAGAFASQEALEDSAELTQRVLTFNFTNAVLFCEAARRLLLKQGGGVLCAFSSVAGDRGRKPVVLYGASKAGLSAYLEGLDHRYHAAGLRVVNVKPGFVKTDMTAGLTPPPFAGTAEGVAKTVAAALDRPRPIVYAPPIWRWILLVIRQLPRFVMRRIGF
ncbi:MAG: SDR family NAD(P)-dependent oxidoreductase [Myxococcales bacterium FL481]|nr:MAG: SDR family NAD(P)-dependent oxidoreductase [Myxococcales bacterium FL481]